MRIRLLMVGWLLWLPASSLAAAADRSLSVTIYAGDLALIQDRRDVEVKGGRQRIEFQDVSAQIRPETVSLTAADIGIVEQNFDFDLLTPAKLMEKAVGQEITIVRVNPATGAETREKAEVLATNGGVVLKIGQRIEVLRDDGLPVRVIFDKVPDNLRARPTLSVTVIGGHAGTRPATLSYLTPGLGWRADYVALYNEADGKIDIQGWVTLTNSSGVTYDNAQTLLVAGTPTLVDGGGRPQNFYRAPQPRATLQQAGTESGSRERLGDYYLYPLAERTTIANLQTKQVSFLDVHEVPAEHGYEFRNRWLGTSETAQSAKSIYSFSTSAHSGLGDQLPAGVLRFYLRDRRGDPQFIGESRIDHTPMGSTLSLATGDAFDVKVRAVVDKRTHVSASDWQSDMRYELSNAMPRPVTVKLLQEGLWGDSRITAESQNGSGESIRFIDYGLSCARSRLRLLRSRLAGRLRADQRNPNRAPARGHESAALRRGSRWNRAGQRHRDGSTRCHRKKSRGRIAQPFRIAHRGPRQPRDPAEDGQKDRQAASRGRQDTIGRGRRIIGRPCRLTARPWISAPG